MRSAPGLVALLVLGAGACDRLAPAAQHAAPDTVAGSSTAAAVVAPDIPALRSVLTEAVAGRTGPGGKGFAVARRTPSLVHYPCSSCHEGAVVFADRSDDVHQDIEPVHPAETGATCASCHLARDVARLALFTGESVPLDHAYRLCGQCHFAQAAAWAGGGHGKRVAAWQGERVVLNCTGCHNPHQPDFPRRIPEPGPVLPGQGGHE